ncbi:unnamed protein product [Soboliphyme baturini]|uniref:Glutathione peroxidase n=1 Tax=Soboliphyme baturini TaxID=241478 RepID=A0A183IM65_9BILA|nr:unnamed protein product [Soboliphyme baturini]
MLRSCVSPRLAALVVTSCAAFAGMASSKASHPSSVYDFEAKDIDGRMVSMSKYKGNVLIVVNVQLQLLYGKYQDQGLRIAAFPCNQFGGQVDEFFAIYSLRSSPLDAFHFKEPNPESEIKKFVSEKFNVTFDMYSKIDVNGKSTHPLFAYLKKSQHGFLLE